jgi:U3 small nucleolar RNA-associated protein 23
MVLEPPSDATIKSKEYVRRFSAPNAAILNHGQVEEQALRPSGSEQIALRPSTSAEPARKKKKGPKGPNPLSVKKKKVDTGSKPPTKDKGKGQEKEPPVSNVRKPVVGEKRKRDDADESGEPEQKQFGDAQNEESKGRKKKRKRKNTTAQVPAVAVDTSA